MDRTEPNKIPKSQLERNGELLFINFPIVIILISFVLTVAFGLATWRAWCFLGFGFWVCIYCIMNSDFNLYAVWKEKRKNRIHAETWREKDRQARAAGFNNHNDRKHAKYLGFTLSSDYYMHLNIEAKKRKAMHEKQNAALKAAETRSKNAAKKAAKKRADEQRRSEKKEKDAKIKAFKRKNFQSDHKLPTNSQMEKAWGNFLHLCISCDADCEEKELSFWWRIYPKLEVVLLCDDCAEEEGLVEEQETTNEKRSRTISEDVKDAVWRRDEGKCTQCGSNEDLEFDHIIPHSKGGANTKRNIQLLCESCNRKKSDKIG